MVEKGEREQPVYPSLPSKIFDCFGSLDGSGDVKLDRMTLRKAPIPHLLGWETSLPTCSGGKHHHRVVEDAQYLRTDQTVQFQGKRTEPR